MKKSTVALGIIVALGVVASVVHGLLAKKHKLNIYVKLN